MEDIENSKKEHFSFFQDRLLSRMVEKHHITYMFFVQITLKLNKSF